MDLGANEVATSNENNMQLPNAFKLLEIILIHLIPVHKSNLNYQNLLSTLFQYLP